jgi:hypothetical protein
VVGGAQAAKDLVRRRPGSGQRAALLRIHLTPGYTITLLSTRLVPSPSTILPDGKDRPARTATVAQCHALADESAAAEARGRGYRRCGLGTSRAARLRFR